jgi:anti-anti-sigma factor
MALAAVRRITDRIRRLIAESEPPVSTAAPRANPRALVEGRLCLHGAGLLRKRLFSLLGARHRTLALDLSRVRFMDGCALAVLVEFAQACLERGTALRLIRPSEQVWNTFGMYGLAEVLVEFADYDGAGMLVVIEEDFPDSIRLPELRPAA